MAFTTFGVLLWTSRETERFMVPVFDAAREGFQNDAAFEKEYKDLDILAEDKSPAADQASVELLCFYTGEHGGEMVLENVVARGKRILPLLRKYRDSPPIVYRRFLANFNRLPARTRRQLFDAAIDDIQKKDW